MVSNETAIKGRKYSSWRQNTEPPCEVALSSALEQDMQRLDEELWISGSKLKDIVKRFREELEEGLQKEGQNISMNVTWVHSLPRGDETGEYLTLDLGGTNLRVCKVTLHGASSTSPSTKSSLDQEKYSIPDSLKTGTADDLWTYIAEKLADFVKSKGLDREYTTQNPMPLGFTFSYPATQDRIDHAILQTWTKGFDIKGVEGEDVASQLREKMEERNLPVELVCVINDTVGAMIASAYNDPETIIGAIFGTGCNAAYMSSISKIKKLPPPQNDPRLRTKAENGQAKIDKSDEKMAINCEYGAFDNARKILPLTKYDETIDAESPRPGEQAFEKLSAGLYLGEIFRLILVDLQARGLIFSSASTSSSPLHTPYILDTGDLSAIENDVSPDLNTIRTTLKQKLNLNATRQEAEVARAIAQMVATRGARLCACGIAAICGMEGISKGHVAADGSVANKHPSFKQRWATALGEVLGWRERGEGVGDREDPIVITSAEDGSGVGCAIIAAMEMARRKEKS
ncbi:hypothetical protein DM02DRAFT_730960 [Periconia macrospinosa]|uniref:Phosphotransferase n=1 Tax=Periconia macrospinosa TaxID=97972 RepID=A0A2V1DI61_9PLEO|nr:hypothetical protein DM02DRAFT_730960 [Periconia macrospinosa]